MGLLFICIVFLHISTVFAPGTLLAKFQFKVTGRTPKQIHQFNYASVYATGDLKADELDNIRNQFTESWVHYYNPFVGETNAAGFDTVTERFRPQLNENLGKAHWRMRSLQ